MSTKDLIKAHNDLAEQFGLPPLNGWKGSKEALQARIDGLSAQQTADPLAIPEAFQEPFGEPEPDTTSPSVSEEATDEYVEPEEHRGGIGQMVRDLLVDSEAYGYQEIVDIVRGEFPAAKTSKRSVASVAAALRRSGVNFPMRRKPRSAKA